MREGILRTNRRKESNYKERKKEKLSRKGGQANVTEAALTGGK